MYPEGIYRLQYRYDFLGNVLESCEINNFGGKENRVLKKYVYDKRSRLLSEQYSINNGPLKKQNNKYNVFLSYDLNGNIQTLLRLNNRDVIDNLSYKYNGNQLL